MASIHSDPRTGVQTAAGFEREQVANDQSLAELLTGLIGDAQTLVRREIDLAKREVAIEVDKAKQGAIALGAGIGLAVVGGLLLAFMLVAVLYEVFNLPMWAGFLIVGGIFAIGGMLLIQQGNERMKTIDPVPRETIESVRKDVQWISEQNPSDKT